MPQNVAASWGELVDTFTDADLAALSRAELYELTEHAYDEMSEIFEGGRQYGIDWPTLHATSPEWYDRLKRLQAAMAKLGTGAN